ncbi:MAG: hypothetical protein ACE5JP_07940 [Candidatus Bipolaricaulia bacterium]
MTAVDSRTPTVEHEAFVYVTSEPKDSEWGQPAASYYEFTTVGTTLRGQLIAEVYLASSSSDIPPIDLHLAAELEAWDAASDEALANFEATLD